MVDGEILERKGNAAAVAEALLLIEEGMLVRPVTGQRANFSAFWIVGAVDKVVQKRALCLYSLPHQLGGKRR